MSRMFERVLADEVEQQVERALDASRNTDSRLGGM
jgi:hypothetical protein